MILENTKTFAKLSETTEELASLGEDQYKYTIIRLETGPRNCYMIIT